ncbi:MAG: zinc-ribbon domain-containing protein [Pseudomonadota bacterium]
MRLTCPNCDAQYEVPDDVIPQEGRDVQCSNCGQTWFQAHPDHIEAEAAAELGPQEPAPTEEVTPTRAAEAEDHPSEEKKHTGERPRKALDPAVADILRQEAEAEQAERRREATEPLESQPDLGLEEAHEADQTAQRTLEARKRMARLRGEPEPLSEAEVTAAAISSRRDLLPDIEEINSTLRSDEDRSGTADAPGIEAPSTRRKRRSFRSGLVLMLVIFAVLALIYIYAPQIAQSVPGMDPLLSAYVAWVDGLRVTLDGYARGATRWLDDAATRSGG